MAANLEMQGAGGDVEIAEEPLFPENLTQLTQQQSLLVRAAKKLEKQCTELEMKFFADVHALDCQYQQKFKEINDKRHQILSGSAVVTEKDVADVPLLYDLEQHAAEQFVKDLKDDASSAALGVPEFWLHALLNCPATSLMIEEEDLAIMKHLKNIECDLIADPMGLVLRFYFEPNQYFSNDVIEKKMVYKLAPSEIYTFDDPIVTAVENTPILWKEGMTPITGKDKPSFFRFFDEKDSDDWADEYDMATVIRDHVIPHAALYYTSELQDDDVDFGDDDSSSDEDEDESMMEE